MWHTTLDDALFALGVLRLFAIIGGVIVACAMLAVLWTILADRSGLAAWWARRRLGRARRADE